MGIMVGYGEYAAGWYGIPALCHDTQIQSHAVTSAGNPIKLDLSNKFVVKGINKELTIDSAVWIYIGKDGKIDKVEDRWIANVPERPTQELQTYSVGSILAWGWQRGKDWMWWAVCTPTWWWTLNLLLRNEQAFPSLSIPKPILLIVISYPTKPYFVGSFNSLDNKALKHPTIKYLSNLNIDFCETKAAHSVPHTKWSTQDWEFQAQSGQVLRGEEAWKRLIHTTRFYDKFSIEPLSAFIQDTADGYDGIVFGNLYTNFVEPGEKKHSDSKGIEWELRVQIVPTAKLSFRRTHTEERKASAEWCWGQGVAVDVRAIDDRDRSLNVEIHLAPAAGTEFNGGRRAPYRVAGA
ncbi:hypothetical protein AUP68_04168 [Ilyonectria robusta]